MKLIPLISLCVLMTTCKADRAALLIIDVQDCFLSGGSLAVKDGNDVIGVINTIRNKYEDAFSLVVFSKDWHCSDHVSFASQHTGRSPLEAVNLQYDEDGNLCFGNSVPKSYKYARECTTVRYNITQMLWPDHCVKNVTTGSTSSGLAENIIKKDSDVIVYKGEHCEVDSYSVFYDNGGFRQTSLQSILQKSSIDTVYVTGLALDYCVYYTALDAKKLGYKTYVVTDAARGVAQDSTTAAVADMGAKGIHLIQSASLKSTLQVNMASPLTSGVGSFVLFSMAAWITGGGQFTGMV